MVVGVVVWWLWLCDGDVVGVLECGGINNADEG